MFPMIVEFACWVAVVGLAASFALALASKWGWLEWAQVHAPSDLLNEMLNCHFCCSWWACVILCLLLLPLGGWAMLLVAPCSTMIAKWLW